MATRAARSPSANRSREDYLAQVRAAAARLVEEGYLLGEDVELVVGNAAERFDLFARQG